MTHIREKWVLNKHRCFPGTVLIEKPLPNLLLFIAQIYPNAKIQQPQYYHIGPDYWISTVQNTNKSFSLIQRDIYIFTWYHKHPKGSSHLLSSLRPTPYLFAFGQLAWKLPKKWEKMYFNFMASSNYHKNPQVDPIERSTDHGSISPKGGLYVIVPAFIIQGTVWRGSRKRWNTRKPNVKQCLLEMSAQTRPEQWQK